jgi:hypothetical protein
MDGTTVTSQGAALLFAATGNRDQKKAASAVPDKQLENQLSTYAQTWNARLAKRSSEPAEVTFNTSSA